MDQNKAFYAAGGLLFVAAVAAVVYAGTQPRSGAEAPPAGAVPANVAAFEGADAAPVPFSPAAAAPAAAPVAAEAPADGLQSVPDAISAADALPDIAAGGTDFFEDSSSAGAPGEAPSRTVAYVAKSALEQLPRAVAYPTRDAAAPANVQYQRVVAGAPRREPTSLARPGQADWARPSFQPQEAADAGAPQPEPQSQLQQFQANYARPSYQQADIFPSIMTHFPERSRTEIIGSQGTLFIPGRSAKPFQAGVCPPGTKNEGCRCMEHNMANRVTPVANAPAYCSDPAIQRAMYSDVETFRKAWWNRLEKD